MQEKVVRCYIHEQAFLARIAACQLRTPQVAVTLGRHILLWNTDRRSFMARPAWVRHELCHVRQFKRYGTLLFLLLYFWESLRRGYTGNRFEVEARRAEADTQPLDLFVFPSC
jgi:hypothetical protein